MNVSYTITGSESAGTQILLVLNGRSHTITESHPSYRQIQERLLSQDFEGLESLLHVQRTILEKLSEKVTIEGETLYYNGEAVYDRLAQTVVEFFREGRSFHNLVNFMENLFENPSRHSRTQLYEFLNRHNFAITDDGEFIAYKGVNQNFLSISSGSAYVNGELVEGRIPNNPGNLIQMDRRDVMDDPTVACSHGLHAGTWEYARSFGPVVVEVKINPRHVASVPNDSNFQKIRTEEYIVLREVKAPVNATQRYDAVEAFLAWLRTVASAYTRKGKLGASYEALAARFIEGQEEEMTEGAMDALYSYAYELDSEHESMAVYRYHVDALFSDMDNEESEDEWKEDAWGWGDYEEDEDEWDEDEDEDERDEWEDEREDRYDW